MFMRLIKQQRAVIDAVAMAEPRTRLEVRVIPCGEEKRKALILSPLPGGRDNEPSAPLD